MEPVRVSLAAGAARSGLRSLIIVGNGRQAAPVVALASLGTPTWTCRCGLHVLGRAQHLVMACSFDGWSSRTAAVAPPRWSLAGPSGCRPSEAVAVIRRHRLECSDDPQLAENDPPLRVVLVVVD